MQTLQTLDYVAIAVYMGLMAGMGLLLGGLVKDVGAYFKAGGTLPWVAAAISNYMSMFSAFVFPFSSCCRRWPLGSWCPIWPIPRRPTRRLRFGCCRRGSWG